MSASQGGFPSPLGRRRSHRTARGGRLSGVRLRSGLGVAPVVYGMGWRVPQRAWRALWRLMGFACVSANLARIPCPQSAKCSCIGGKRCLFRREMRRDQGWTIPRRGESQSTFPCRRHDLVLFRMRCEFSLVSMTLALKANRRWDKRGDEFSYLNRVLTH
jgi:hypothetical protein